MPIKSIQRLRLTPILAIALLGCEAATPASDTQGADPNFDANHVWQHVRADFDLFYAYRDQRGFDADAYLDRVTPYIASASSREALRERLHRMSYAFTDPHLGFGPYAPTDFNIIPTAADLEVGWADETYEVIDVRANSAAQIAGIRPGWTLTHADGQTLETQIKTVFEGLIETPSQSQKTYAATVIANGRRSGERTLRFVTPQGETVEMTLSNPRDFAQAVNNLPPIETQRRMSASGQSIAVMRINNRLGDNDLIKEFDTAITAVLDADGLILDLRNTPSGGNTEVARSIMGHFVTEAAPYQMHERPSLEREFGVPRRFVEYVLPREPFFDPEKTVVLSGPWTGSMGEGITIGLDAIGVTTVASDMGDLLGGLSNFSFDEQRIKLDIPTETLFHVNGTPREDFIADIPLSSADTGVDGLDPGLAAAVTVLEHP